MGQKYQLNSQEEYQPAKTMVANILICWLPRQFCNKPTISRDLICPAGAKAPVDAKRQFSELSSLALVAIADTVSVITVAKNDEGLDAAKRPRRISLSAIYANVPPTGHRPMPITTKIWRAQAPHSRYHAPNPVIAVYGRTARACKLIRHGQSYVALTADDAFLAHSAPIPTRRGPGGGGGLA